MVFVAVPKLRGPVPRHMAWKTCMQQVARGSVRDRTASLVHGLDSTETSRPLKV